MQQLKQLEQFNQVYKKHKKKQKVTHDKLKTGKSSTITKIENRFPYLSESDSTKDILDGTSLIPTLGGYELTNQL
jgi:hypothetical protein